MREKYSVKVTQNWPVLTKTTQNIAIGTPYGLGSWVAS